MRLLFIRDRFSSWVLYFAKAGFLCLVSTAPTPSFAQSFHTGGNSLASPILDRLEALYDTRLIRNNDGVPLISLRLLKGQRTVSFRSVGPVVVTMGKGDGHMQLLPGNTTWTVRLGRTTRPVTKSWVLAERFGGQNASRARVAQQRWRNLGFTSRIEVSGHVSSFGEFNSDSRKYSIFLRPQGSKGRIKQFAERLKADYKVHGRVVSQVLSRAGGDIVASSAENGVEQLVSDGLFSIRPLHPLDEIDLLNVAWPSRRKGIRSYRGTLHFLVGPDRRLLVINRTDAETVVSGVVTSELYPGAPAESIKAQAVLARGQLFTHLGHRHPGQPYHLCAEHHCQAFHGIGKITPKSLGATAQTRGQVLMHDKTLVPPAYHAACGGHTEAYGKMWGGGRSKVMVGTPDGNQTGNLTREGRTRRFISKPTKAWCRASASKSGSFRWVVRRPGSVISKRVSERKNIGKVIDIQVQKRGLSGRALVVEYVGDRGTYTAVGATLNRRILGGLKSGLWYAIRVGGTAEDEPSEWVFRGGGYGHGVGLCQHGAIGMAAAGRNYTRILMHYFRASRLVSLW